jgi:hypothetical protein
MTHTNQDARRRMPIAALTMNATVSASVSRTIFDAGRSSPRW